jgi:arylsulfatase A-like enzyme
MKQIKLYSLLILPLLYSCGPEETRENKKPNILFLLADDMGYGELGSYGQEIIKTPFLDSLANQGMRFTDFYAGSAVCSPSRAVLMTGKHAGHATIRGNNGLYPDGSWHRVPLKRDEITLGEMLKDAGYQTAFIGKWHLEDPDSIETWAINRGFDYVVQEQWSETHEDSREFEEPVHWENGWNDSIRYDPEDYDCIDEFRTNIALNYLDQKDKDKPFFLFMSYRTPHAHEYYIREKELYSDKGWPEAERKHAARITLLDREIERLLKRLEKDGELENTIIFFTSDNGPTIEGHDHEFFNSNGVLRGHKRDMYEGGIREPLIVYWKDKIEAASISRHPSAFYDVMPTLAELAEINPPEVTDGISFLPELLGKEQRKHEYLYWELQLMTVRPRINKGFIQAARTGKWKAVRYGADSPLELYNLETDISEQQNLANEFPEITRKMDEFLKTARINNEYYPLR